MKVRTTAMTKLTTYYEFWKKKPYSGIITFTFVYFAVAFLIWHPFLFQGRTMINDGDGLRQHYTALVYLRRWAKEIIFRLLQGEGFHVPMFDCNIGYGADLLTTFSYYGFADPFTYLTLLVHETHVDIMYGVIHWLKIYCAGLAAYAFFRYHGRRRLAAIPAALLYCFSGFSIFMGRGQLSFLSAVVWFPLVCLGADMLLDGKSPRLFTAALFFAAVSNFYFFYMMVILTLGYVITRALAVKKLRGKALLAMAGRFLVFGALGTALAGFLLLPVLTTVLSTARITYEKSIPWHYPLSFYLTYPAGFIGIKSPISWTSLSFTPVVFLCDVLLFTIRKRYGFLKLGVIALFLMSCLPAAGTVMNGFSYPSNRWIWAFGLVNAYVFSVVFEEAALISRGGEVFLLLMTATCVGFNRLTVLTDESSVKISCAALMIMTVLFFLFREIRILRKFLPALLFFCAVSGIGLTGLLNFASWGNDAAKEAMAISESYREMTEPEADSLLQDLPGLYRITDNGLGDHSNSQLIRRVNGTNYYFSVVSPWISEYLDRMGFNVTRAFQYRSEDDRSIAEALSMTRYAFVREGEEGNRPFDYHPTERKMVKDDEVFTLYEADEPLPVGYTYDAYIPRKRFDEMNLADRQAAMLYGAVMEESSLPEAAFETGQKSIFRGIEENENISVEGEEIIVREEEASAVLLADVRKDAETYVYVKSTDFHYISPLDLMTEEERAALSREEYQELRFEGKPTQYSIGASYGEKMDVTDFMLKDNIYYGGHTETMINLGDLQPEEGKELRIHFEDRGIYRVEGIDVFSQPTEEIRKGIHALHETVLTGVEMGINRITGELSTDRKKILVLSVPYSPGWRVKIDGLPGSCVPANIMYLGVEVPSGSHRIEFTYQTPYLAAGAGLSLAALLILLGLGIGNQRKNKKNGSGS